MYNIRCVASSFVSSLNVSHRADDIVECTLLYASCETEQEVHVIT